MAVVLRECAQRLKKGGWMVVFAASSWRSISYMVEAVRGVVEPIRIGTWTKPAARTKARTGGWAWASVSVIVFRKGKSDLPPTAWLDHIEAPPLTVGRRAQLPPEVARWAVEPFATARGVMLDPFAGSFALCEAAEACGMISTGIERREETEPDSLAATGAREGG